MNITPSNTSLPKVAFLSMSATFLSSFLTGCQPTPESKNEKTPSASSVKPALSSPPLLPTVTTNVEDKNNDAKNDVKADNSHIADSGKQIANQLEVSYAREAANVNNRCPKLVEFQLASQVITRSNEQLLKDSCDYLIYLNEGDRLQVAVSNDLQAQLITPVAFDFSQGAYIAPQFDKYTVRIRYNGSRFQPKNLNYNVILTRSGKTNRSAA